MAQFDVLENRTGFYEDVVPYFLDVQSDFLEFSRTRVVVPLRLGVEQRELFDRLTPVFDVAGQRVAMMTQEITHLPQRDLGDFIASLTLHRDEIMRAVDVLITGF